VTPKDIDLFELHDAFTIMSVLSLEACGFAERGRGVRLGTEGDITIGGQIPITTMGGLKARGHPVGATGSTRSLRSPSNCGNRQGRTRCAMPVSAWRRTSAAAAPPL